MRVVLLTLLVLINTCSLPLQAMNMRIMPANISCHMQDMPCNSENEMSEMQHDNLQYATSQNSSDDCSNMDNCSDCNITCLSSFINYNNNKLLLDIHKQSNSLRYELNSTLQQHLDSLYRPPLIS